MTDTKDDIEAQVDRALAEHYKSRNFILDEPSLRTAMRDLLLGKFKEEPLPEIARPPWPHSRVYVFNASVRGVYYVSVYSSGNWGDFNGPDAKTPREAILAWNEVFGEKPYRAALRNQGRRPYA